MRIIRCCRKEKNPPQDVAHCVKAGAAVLMGHPMDHLFNSNKNPPLASHEERRKHPRETRSIKASYMVKGRWRKGSVQNISEGGAYIGTFDSRTFSPGDAIFLVARIRVLRDQIRSKIAWVGPHGMGIEFQITECS